MLDSIYIYLAKTELGFESALVHLVDMEKAKEVSEEYDKSP